MFDWEEREEPVSEDYWLRERVSRVDALAEFLSGLMPSAVGGEAWAQWLDKGEANKAPSKVRSARTSNRQALIENRRTVRKLRSEKERYEEKARVAAEALEEAQDVEQMILFRLLGLRLVALLGPRFTMGPAWTVLRAIAFPKYNLPRMMRDHGEKKFEGMVEFLDELANPDETATSIWRTLFFSAGDAEFESRLHIALADVCRDFDPGRNWRNETELDESQAEERIHVDDQERLEFLRRLSFDDDDPRPRGSRRNR